MEISYSTFSLLWNPLLEPLLFWGRPGFKSWQGKKNLTNEASGLPSKKKKGEEKRKRRNFSDHLWLESKLRSFGCVCYLCNHLYLYMYIFYNCLCNHDPCRKFSNPAVKGGFGGCVSSLWDILILTRKRCVLLRFWNFWIHTLIFIQWSIWCLLDMSAGCSWVSVKYNLDGSFALLDIRVD